MLLTIDIGNTMVTMGVFDGNRLATTLRVATETRRLADEYGLLLTNLLGVNGVVILGHGRSHARAVVSGLQVAEQAVRAALVPTIADGLSGLTASA